MSCPLCGEASNPRLLAEASWLPPAVLLRLARLHPGWRGELGACPACAQTAFLQALLQRGEPTPQRHARAGLPLDSGAPLGVLPTRLHLHADGRYTGQGVTLALVDSGFHPHSDLTQPRNRIRAWADTSRDPVRYGYFDPHETPRWPGSDSAAPTQWHGLMTSAVAAGNGRLSHGLYRGLASEADLILVQVREVDGHIGNGSIARALRWLREIGPALGLRVVSLSVGGDPIGAGEVDPVDEAVSALVADGIAVIAAAGNDGCRRLVPPASSPEALTIGGLDDKNTFNPAEVELWHGNYGRSLAGSYKPELVAPSIWVAAPLLPGTRKAEEAVRLFSRRGQDDPEVEVLIATRKFVTPHYHHVDGTSVAAPLVASTVVCMLEANPALTPRQVRRLLQAAAVPVTGAARERQGAGALDAGRALALALRERHGPLAGSGTSRGVTTPRA